eukprot:gene11374-23807_t
MAPRRKKSDLILKSIWDEILLTNYLAENGANTRHAKKIWNWMLAHPDVPLNDVPLETWSVPKVVADGIRSNFVKFTTTIVEKLESARGDTTKLLIKLQDDHRIEAVIIRHNSHITVCISSQVGCQMGCRFCATGTMGIIGDLTSSEILEQLIHANMISRIRNVVFMGMGEPLNNYENVKLAVEFMIDTKRFGLSPRHITVSTVGVVKNMYRLAEDLPSVHLALSLHAPNQELRVKIVPTASAYKIDQLMSAVDNHITLNSKPNKSKTLERYKKSTCVMIEYILIKDVNDLPEHAHELGKLLYSRRAYIILNLIPYNPTNVTENYQAPTRESIQQFFQICISNDYRIYTRIRQEMGQDIAGACGQLALVNTSSSKSSTSDMVDIEDISTSRFSRSASSISGIGSRSRSSSLILDSIRFASDMRAFLYGKIDPNRITAIKNISQDIAYQLPYALKKIIGCSVFSSDIMNKKESTEEGVKTQVEQTIQKGLDDDNPVQACMLPFQHDVTKTFYCSHVVDVEFWNCFEEFIDFGVSNYQDGLV